MEFYILLAIIWGVGVIWSNLYRMLILQQLPKTVRFSIGTEQALKSFVIDFLWFIYIPWLAIKLLFKDV